MTSIRSAEPTIPPEDTNESPAAAKRVVIVIHSPALAPNGRATAPDGDPEFSEPHTGTIRRGGRHRREDREWFDLVDDVVHSRPLTLRVVLLIFAVATGSAAVVMALGVVGHLALVSLAAGRRQERRRRLRALQTGDDLPTK